LTEVGAAVHTGRYVQVHVQNPNVPAERRWQVFVTDDSGRTTLAFGYTLAAARDNALSRCGAQYVADS
jgi:hypothetical protein